MTDKEFYVNVDKIIDMLLQNAAKSFGLDIAVINETAIEVRRRMREADDV